MLADYLHCVQDPLFAQLSHLSSKKFIGLCKQVMIKVSIAVQNTSVRALRFYMKTHLPVGNVGHRENKTMRYIFLLFEIERKVT
jgi:hypothetical protein